MSTKSQNVADGIIIGGTIAYAITYSSLGFFTGTILSVMALPWFFLIHSEDDGLRKSLFIMASWLTTVMAFVFILARTSDFFSDDKDSYQKNKNIERNSVPNQKKNTVRYLLISQVIVLLICIICQALRVFHVKRSTKHGYRRKR